MFRTKLVSFNATTSEPPKTNNVPIDVIVVTPRCQWLEQQVFKERESVKAKGVEDW